MQLDSRAGPGSGWRTTELTPGVMQGSDSSDRGGWKGGRSRGHCFGGLHRCLAPPPAPGLKSGAPKASRCQEWPLWKAGAHPLAAAPTGLGSAGVLLTCPGLEQCLRLSPRCGLALTPPPLWLQHKQGKVGPDGKELIPHESPRVGGFGFVSTPSPAPGERRALCGTTGACPHPGAQGRIHAAPGSQMGPTSDAWRRPVWTRVWKPGLICRKWGVPGPPGAA